MTGAPERAVRAGAGLVFQNPDDQLFWCDGARGCVVWPAEGRIVADGPTRDVFRRTELLCAARVRAPWVAELWLSLASSGSTGGDRMPLTVGEAKACLGGTTTLPSGPSVDDLQKAREFGEVARRTADLHR